MPWVCSLRWAAGSRRADDTPGSPETVMLTYGYWQRRFGGDKSMVGRTLTIDSKPRTVIGVMPQEFRFLRDPDLILPQQFDRNKVFLGTFSYQGIARLKPGVTLRRPIPIWPHAGHLAQSVARAAGIRSALFFRMRASDPSSSR